MVSPPWLGARLTWAPPWLGSTLPTWLLGHQAQIFDKGVGRPAPFVFGVSDPSWWTAYVTPGIRCRPVGTGGVVPRLCWCSAGGRGGTGLVAGAVLGWCWAGFWAWIVVGDDKWRRIAVFTGGSRNLNLNVAMTGT